VPQDNVERVRAILPPDGTDLAVAFGPERGFSSAGLMAEDLTVRFVSDAAGQMGGTGPDAFYDRWADWLEPWESYRIYSDGLQGGGDRVVWLVRLHGVTKRGGVEMDHEAAAIFRFEGDLVCEIVFALDRSNLDD
jgi:hypothetical protein